MGLFKRSSIEKRGRRRRLWLGCTCCTPHSTLTHTISITDANRDPFKKLTRSTRSHVTTSNPSTDKRGKAKGNVQGLDFVATRHVVKWPSPSTHPSPIPPQPRLPCRLPLRRPPPVSRPFARPQLHDAKVTPRGHGRAGYSRTRVGENQPDFPFASCPQPFILPT